MNVLGVIPARGGSKGIPRKNIKLLDGVPLIAYTIKEALSSRLLSRVIVSTEDDEISSIARQYGADVPFLRPRELATDNALAIPTMQHAMEAVEKLEMKKYDVLVMLQPTTPFRSHEDIDGALELLKASKADSVISVALNMGQHPAKMKYVHDDRLIDPPFAEVNENSPRQRLRDVYRLNGALYITRRDILFNNSFKGKDSRAWIMPEERSVNLDSRWDWLFAEMLIKNSLVPAYQK